MMMINFVENEKNSRKLMELIPKKLIPTKICQTFSLAPSNEQNLQKRNFANQNQ